MKLFRHAASLLIFVIASAAHETEAQVANMYFSGIERNDGRGEYPIADDCARLENGTVTAGDPTCSWVEAMSSEPRAVSPLTTH